MIERVLFLAIIVVASSSAVEAVTIHHDKVQPFAQTEPITVSEKAAVKFKPSLQIVDGCHPYPAVNKEGQTSGGAERNRGRSARGRIWAHKCTVEQCGKDLFAIMYAWYFPKDNYGGMFPKGHRHNWASAVVWLDNPALEKPKILAVSTRKRGGDYAILKNEPAQCYRYRCDPKFAEYINMTTPMLSYKPSIYGPSFHSLQPTTTRGAGELQDLVMWEQLSDEARIALGTTKFGDKSPVPFIDANLNATLEAARPFL